MINLVFVEDHPMFLDGMQSNITDESDIQVLGHAKSGNELFDNFDLEALDLITLDIKLPGMDGIEITKKIREEFPNLKVIIVSSHNNREYIIQLMELNIEGYILKENAHREHFLTAIRKVASGKNHYDEQLVLAAYSKELLGGPKRDDELSRRQLEVARDIVDGLTIPESAENLGIATRTIAWHRNQMIHKLGAKNISDLTGMLISKGIEGKNSK